MHKRYIHHLLKRLRGLSYIVIIAGLLISGTTFVFAYRNNNLEALRLRDVVLKTDKEGGDVEGALRELRQFTYTHMNAGLSTGPGTAYPPIQLKYRYERLLSAERTRVSVANQQVAGDAQRRCEAPGVSAIYGSRTKCVEVYMTAHKQEVEKPIPDALYKFDFVAPIWSPDKAGWGLVAAGVFALLLLIRIVLELWLRHALRE